MTPEKLGRHTPIPRGQAPALGPRMPISPDLLAVLVCPACKGDLVYDVSAETLTCNACRLRYRIVDDIPVMLSDEAEKF
jgi:uncharacterized protein YbaR (Trm112 family)